MLGHMMTTVHTQELCSLTDFTPPFEVGPYVSVTPHNLLVCIAFHSNEHKTSAVKCPLLFSQHAGHIQTLVTFMICNPPK